MSEAFRQERRALQRAAVKAERAANSTYKHAHKLVASTAKEFAGTFYEEAAHSDAFYNHFPDQKAFIAAEWHNFIPSAREQLAALLASNAISEQAKEEIFDALAADRQLPRPDNVHRLLI